MGKKEQSEQKKSTKAAAKSAKQQQKLQEQIDDLARQVDTLTEDVKRERADFMNYKRRSELDQMQIMQTAKSEIILQILPIFDDLERALAAAPEDIAQHSWVKGVGQVYRQVQSKLAELGVERIDATGKAFDPQLHEAVGFEDGDGSDEVVIEELRPGYQLGEAVLRPSMVKVGKPTTDGEAASTGIDESNNNKEE